MTQKHLHLGLVLFTLVVGGWGVLPAGADITGALTIQAANSSGSGSLTINLGDGQWSGPDWSWSLPAPIPVFAGDGTTLLGTLLSGDVTISAAMREIQLDIGVRAGDSATDFSVVTPLLSFPTMSGAEAEGMARAAIELTETEGVGGTAIVYGDPPGTGIFRAQYNGGAADFTTLVGLVTADDGSVATGSESDPKVGYRPYGVAVDDMNAKLAFKLTASDEVRATSSYGAVPEPASGLLMLLVSGFVGRRMRRR
ncbi:MAG: PEP-CTERM sorting domain-containing protein [Planctomycetes bacterium]|nr:PEP-CTERM sorting domain-containing protein [Planctomycetota bacterium]